MVLLNDSKPNIVYFPDGTKLIRNTVINDNCITWKYDSEDELLTVLYLAAHCKSKGRKVELFMPYIPNARMDRIKKPDEVFTLKYFANLINSAGFHTVTVLDPHSPVSEALINRLHVFDSSYFIKKAIDRCKPDVLFFPDEGALKKYTAVNDWNMPYGFGVKKRDWRTGKIKSLKVEGFDDWDVKGEKVLIVDDICSKGGTFYHSATTLDEMGAKEIYLYVTHCENTISQGELLNTDLIKKIYTTDSIYRGDSEKVEVFNV